MHTLTPHPDWQAFEAYTAALLARHNVPGMSAAASSLGRRALSRGYGMRSREDELAATEETVYGIGSITKSFTAVVIMQLQEEGRLRVEDPVNLYLPEFRIKDPAGTAGMTIHHFLTHSSGLPPLPTLMFALSASIKADPTMADQIAKSTPFAKHPGIATPEQLMEFIAALDFELLAPPGVQFSYSNDSWALLGTIIERVTGRSYEDAVRERILRPLGMTRTGFDIAALEANGNVTTCHTARDVEGRSTVVTAPLWWEAPAMVAAGFLRSTAPDMLRYAEIFRSAGARGGTHVLSGRSVERMLTPYMEYTPGAHYGYGLMIRTDYHGHRLVEHSGGIKGVAAHLTVAPDAGLAAVALANLDNVPSGQVALAAINAMLGLPVATSRVTRREYRYPESHLRRLVGTYVSAEGLGSEVQVSLAAGSLKARLQGQEYRMTFIGPNTLVIRQKEEDDGTTVRVLATRQGDVYGVLAGARVLLKKKS